VEQGAFGDGDIWKLVSRRDIEGWVGLTGGEFGELVVVLVAGFWVLWFCGLG
jgi:hypothetical protein